MGTWWGGGLAPKYLSSLHNPHNVDTGVIRKKKINKLAPPQKKKNKTLYIVAPMYLKYFENHKIIINFFVEN